MTESRFNALPPMITSAAPMHRDRKTGLVIFGILEIAMGSFCVLAIAMVALTRALGVGSANPPPQGTMLMPLTAIYAVAAGLFVFLGTGSIRARRWARAIIL